MTAFRTIRIFAAALLAVAVCGAAQAQKPGKAERRAARQAGHLNLAALPVDIIDSVVSLNADQKKQITAIHGKYVADARALRPASGQTPDPANRQKLRELTQTASAEIEAVLNADQKAKLQVAASEIRAVAGTGIPPAVAVQLKLTDDQKSKIASIVRSTRDKIKGGADPKATRKDARAQVEALLTPEQKSIVQSYLASHRRHGARKA